MAFGTPSFLLDMHPLKESFCIFEAKLPKNHYLILESEQHHMEISPFSHPIYVMAKPAGAQCNLACRYCYYLEKSGMYGHSGGQNMSREVLELFVKQYIAAQTQREVLFVWHGGETMLRPLSFYQEALRLQKKYLLCQPIPIQSF